MTYDLTIGTNDFAENPEPRVPCVLLLDVSGSMNGPPIRQLNDGIVAFKDAVAADMLASKRVEVAVITFGGQVCVFTPFTTVAAFQPTRLEASGDTPMGAAILRAIDEVKARKEEYKRNGIAYYRPWIFMITDGGPTDSWKQAAEEIARGEQNKEFLFLAVAVQGANLEILNQIAPGGVRQLQGLEFRELFLWLSASMRSVSHSTMGTAIKLPSTDKWAVI